MKIATLSKDGKLALPKEIAKKFTEADKFVVIEEGGMVILNPIRMPDVSGIAKRVKDTEPMSLEEISEEVHRYRKDKRGK
jgi:hypothetical protein